MSRSRKQRGQDVTALRHDQTCLVSISVYGRHRRSSY